MKNLGLALMAVALLAGAANAATFTWTGNATGDTWNFSGTTNWLGNVLPTVNDNTTDIVFVNTGASRYSNQTGLNNGGVGYTVRSLAFNSTTTGPVLIGLSTGNTTSRNLTMGSDTGTSTISVATSGNWTHVIGSNPTLGTMILANNLSVAIDSSTTSLAINRPITTTLSRGITKTGIGLLTLGGANTYNGTTLISAGTLALGASGSIANTSSIGIGAGATFNVSAPGSYSMLGAQPFTFNLDGTGSGSAGLLSAAGLNITSGNVTFNVVNPLDDPVYVLANYTSLTGSQFNSVTAPSGYNINYGYNGGTQIALIAVPEPATLALLGAGGLSGFFLWSRRRARRHRG